MKVSKLIKLLEGAKEEFGDIDVGLDASTFNDWNADEQQFSEESCVIEPSMIGVFRLRFEGDRTKKVIVFGADNDSHLAEEQNLLDGLE